MFLFKENWCDLVGMDNERDFDCNISRLLFIELPSRILYLAVWAIINLSFKYQA